MMLLVIGTLLAAMGARLSFAWRQMRAQEKVVEYEETLQTPSHAENRGEVRHATPQDIVWACQGPLNSDRTARTCTGF